MVLAKDLTVGGLYFLVTYDDPHLRRPIVISYEYLGVDLKGESRDSGERKFYFRYLPAFEVDTATSLERDPATDARSDLPHRFSESDLESLRDLDGLMAELEDVRSRQEKRR